MYEIYTSGADDWNNHIYKHKVSYRSLFEWGEYKESMGWKVLRFKFIDDSNKKYLFQCTYKAKSFFGAFYIPDGSINIFKDIKILKLFLKKYTNTKLLYIRIDDSKTTLKVNNNNTHNRAWTRPWYRVNNSLSAVLNTSEYVGTDNTLSNNYKKNLKKSLKFQNNIIITNNPDPNDLVEITTKMNEHKEMEIHSFRDFDMMNKKLKKFIKFIVIYDSNENPISYRGALIIHNYAWELCAASSFIGRKQSAGYKTMHEICKSFNALNIKNYHLGALSPKMQGVSDFKLSTGSKPITYTGEYEYSNIPFVKYIINSIIFLTLSRNARKFIPFLARFNY